MPICPPIPEPPEAYAAQLDDLISPTRQGVAVRAYLAGLLLSAERNNTLTALASTMLVVRARPPAAQRRQWFLSESPGSVPWSLKSWPRKYRSRPNHTTT